MENFELDEYSYGVPSLNPPPLPAAERAAYVPPAAAPRSRKRRGGFWTRFFAMVLIAGGVLALFSYAPVANFVEQKTGAVPIQKITELAKSAWRFFTEKHTGVPTAENNQILPPIEPLGGGIIETVNEYEFMFYRPTADFGERIDEDMLDEIYSRLREDLYLSNFSK